MAWNEATGVWFKLGTTRFPNLATWKTLSAVRGASRTGGIAKVDAALDKASAAAYLSPIDKYLGANTLLVACVEALRGIGRFDLQAKQRREAIEELRNRAQTATDMLRQMVPVIQTILAHPTDVYQLVNGRSSAHVIANALFRNFIDYAGKNWHYTGQSNMGGEDLLYGRTQSIPCGGIANALKIVAEVIMPKPCTFQFTTLSGYLRTKSKYRCFDTAVRGNVRSLADAFDGTCLFKNHYFLTWAGLYFDPCMTAIYTAETELIEEKLFAIHSGNPTVVAKENARKNSDSVYVFDGSTTAPGFSSTWVRFPLAQITDADALERLAPTSLKRLLAPGTSASGAIVGFGS